MRVIRLSVLPALAFAAAACVLGFSPAHAQDDASPAPAVTNPPIPSPKPAPDDPKIHKLAVQQFLAWQSGTVDRSVYSDQVNADLTDDVMDRGTRTLANLGALQQAQFLGLSTTHGVTFYVYKMTCANGTIRMEFSIDADGKIGLIFFE